MARDITPFLIAGAVALAAVLLSGPEPPAAPPPKGSPPPPPTDIPPPSLAPMIRPSYPPLFLWVFQDGAADWSPIGWYYGHTAHVQTSSSPARDVWFTPEGEVVDVLQSLLAQGINGWFDTIEPDGFEDKNIRGRLDAVQHVVWFFDESDPSDPHYVRASDHHIVDMIG